MEQWASGIYLLGRYSKLRTGCWLLVHGSDAAIVEMPPFDPDIQPPWEVVAAAVTELKVQVRYLLCTHSHSDHIDKDVLQRFHNLYPTSKTCLQLGFRQYLSGDMPINYFAKRIQLSLGGEELHLLHAPKHSWTDTMIIFRGCIITGDWELNTIRSVHDGKGNQSVPADVKLKSINNLIEFTKQTGYRIHKVFAVHANDRQENVNFIELMENTKIDR